MDGPDRCSGNAPIPVLEEVATLSKRTVVTGVATVEKQIESRHHVISEVLQTGGASVDRVPVGTVVDAANPPQVRTENGVTIIPVLEEVLVVEKRLMLKEELHIRQYVDETLSSQEVTLQIERVVLKHREATPADQDQTVKPLLHGQIPPISRENQIMTHTLVAAFDTLAQANAAKAQLLSHNILESNIKLSSSELTGSEHGAGDNDDHEPFGQKVGNFFGSLFSGDDGDKPHRYATAYPEAYRRGATLLTATLDTDEQLEQAEDILEHNGAFDIDERSSTWNADTVDVSGAAAPLMDTRLSEDLSIPVIEESLRVGKRVINTGRVRVVSRVTERPIEETVSLHEEHAYIERHAVDRAATADELDSFKEGSIEIQETAEELVVEKTARVVEEVSFGKRPSDHMETVRDTVRRTDVDVQTEPGSTVHRDSVINPDGLLKARP